MLILVSDFRGTKNACGNVVFSGRDAVPQLVFFLEQPGSECRSRCGLDCGKWGFFPPLFSGLVAFSGLWQSVFCPSPGRAVFVFGSLMLEESRFASEIVGVREYMCILLNFHIVRRVFVSSPISERATFSFFFGTCCLGFSRRSCAETDVKCLNCLKGKGS